MTFSYTTERLICAYKLIEDNMKNKGFFGHNSYLMG